MNNKLIKTICYPCGLIASFAFANRVFAANFNQTLKTLLPSGDPTSYSLDSIGILITNVTNFALDIAGVIAFIMILYASIMYLTSYGEEGKAEIAKKTLMWSIIGILAVALAKSMILIVYNILNK